MASLICSAIVLFTTYFLLPYLYYLPKCVLASMQVHSRRLMCLLVLIFVFLCSICLVVISLLGETPSDVRYFWKYVLAIHRTPRYHSRNTVNTDNYQNERMGGPHAHVPHILLLDHMERRSGHHHQRDHLARARRPSIFQGSHDDIGE